MENKIGDIINSKIENIVQTIENSVAIPNDLKELLMLWLMLSKEEFEWQKEQRLKAKKETWLQEKNAFRRKRANSWSGIIFLSCFLLSMAVLISFYFYPFFQHFILQHNGNTVTQIYLFLEYLMTPRKEMIYAMTYVVFLMGFSFVAGGWIGRACANKKFGKYFRLQ